MSTRPTFGQFKGQFKGAMKEMSQKVQNASSHPSPLRKHKVRGQFSGAVDKLSGKVRNASTHILGRKNYVHVHSSRSVQGGNGGKVYARADGKHTLDALLGPMLVLVRVAVPWISSPAPCKAKKTERVTFQRGDALKFRECSKCKLLLHSAHMQGSTQWGQWRKCHRRFKMRALTPEKCRA